MKKTYKRTFFKLITNTAYTIAAPFIAAIVLYFAGSFFASDLVASNNGLIGIGAISVIVLILMILNLFGDHNIIIEVDEESLKYYTHGGKKLQNTYYLKDYSFGFKRVTGRSTAESIDLIIKELSTGQEVRLDCEAIGYSQTEDLYNNINTIQSKIFNNNQSEILEAK